MRVERYNYAAQFDDLDSLLEQIRITFINGDYILSEDVSRFEKLFSTYIGSNYACGVNSGTDALVIALMSLGVTKGDQVVTQANTFNASVAAICLVGATPVLVDADEESFLINESQVSATINRKTKVIIPTHLYGKPTPLENLLQLANRYDLFIVEDAAQAHGARLDGRCVGSLGAVGCFSFHPSKNLAAAGDGGAITTNSEELNVKIQQYRSLGQSGQNNHVVLGLNSKLDAVQALVLAAKLPKLDEWNKQRRIVAGWYMERLSELPLRFQSTSPTEQHVYHLFQIRTDRRDQLLDFLRHKQIDATIRYPTPIHLQKAFSDHKWRKGEFPVAERLAKELLCLPLRPDLTLDDVDYVAENIRAFFVSKPV